MPPTKFAQFIERVPMVKGRLDKKASTATAYAWFVWEKESSAMPRLMWVPPVARALSGQRAFENMGIEVLFEGVRAVGLRFRNKYWVHIPIRVHPAANRNARQTFSVTAKRCGRRARTSANKWRPRRQAASDCRPSLAQSV